MREGTDASGVERCARMSVASVACSPVGIANSYPYRAYLGTVAYSSTALRTHAHPPHPGSSRVADEARPRAAGASRHRPEPPWYAGAD